MYKKHYFGEGGAIVTSDPKVMQFVMDSRLLGVQKDTEKRFSGQRRLGI